WVAKSPRNCGPMPRPGVFTVYVCPVCKRRLDGVYCSTRHDTDPTRAVPVTTFSEDALLSDEAVEALAPGLAREHAKQFNAASRYWLGRARNLLQAALATLKEDR